MFAHFIEEVIRELVLSRFQIVFRQSHAPLHWDVQRVLVTFEQVYAHHVSHARRVVPGPHTQLAGLIDRLIGHEIFHERVEVLVGESSHGSPQPSHLQFGLVIHLSEKLLSVFELHFEFMLLLSKQIGSLFLEVLVLVCLLGDGGGVFEIDETFLSLVVVKLVIRQTEKPDSFCHL